MVKLTAEQRIHNFLKGKGKGYTSKQISAYLKINHNTVRKILGSFNVEEGLHSPLKYVA